MAIGAVLGAVFPSLLVSIVNYIIARKMLDAQKDMRARMKVFANRNMEMAEELHGSFMALRAWDQRVYGHVLGLSCRPRCDDQEKRGASFGNVVANARVQATVFGHSRYNTGNRSAAIRDALAASAAPSGEVAATAGNYEDMLVEACQQARWTAIAQSATFKGYNPSSAFAGIASSMSKLENTYQAQANGALTGFGSALTHFAVPALQKANAALSAPAPTIINDSLADKRLGL